MLLRFLKLLFELNHVLHQISHLTGISSACLLPGLLCGIEGLNKPVLGDAVLLEPVTLRSIVGCEWSVRHFAPLAIFSRMALFGAPLLEPPPCACFLGTRNSAALVAVATFALLALAFPFYFSTDSFLMFLRSIIIALGDSGKVQCVKSYWFLHATGR